MKNEKTFEQLKKEFLRSATELLDYMYINNKNFDSESYPSYLPSFDELLYDLYDLEEIDE